MRRGTVVVKMPGGKHVVLAGTDEEAKAWADIGATSLGPEYVDAIANVSNILGGQVIAINKLGRAKGLSEID